MDRSGSREGQLASNCKCGNEPYDSLNCGEFLG